MIRLITGVPGAGKTLFAVSSLLKEMKNNPDRKVFCDIKGLKIDGVDLPPDDWREAPDGSLIIYDECQYRDMYKRGRGASRYSAILDLTTHRHTGKDIWLITQSPTFIHGDVLLLVEEHYHLSRPFGAKVANLYKWRQGEKKPESRAIQRRAESKSFFKYDKKLFEYYESVDVDEKNANHKGLRLPLSAYFPLLVGVLIVAWAVYSFFNDDDNALTKTKDNKEKSANVQKQQAIQNPLTPNVASVVMPSVASVPASVPAVVDEVALLEARYLSAEVIEFQKSEIIRPASVIAIGGDCVAYNKFGERLNIDRVVCKKMLVNNDLPRDRGAKSYAPAMPASVVAG